MTSDPRKLLLGSGSAPDFEKLTQQRYERECVTFLLNRLGLGDYKPDLLEHSENHSGQRQLQLLSFCGVISDFPFYLAAATPKIKAANLYVVFKDFKKTPLYAAYQHTVRDRPREFSSRHAAVIVKWPYVPYGLVVHNYCYSGVDGTRLVYQQGRLEYVIEPLEQFTSYLCKTWAAG